MLPERFGRWGVVFVCNRNQRVESTFVDSSLFRRRGRSQLSRHGRRVDPPESPTYSVRCDHGYAIGKLEWDVLQGTSRGRGCHEATRVLVCRSGGVLGASDPKSDRSRSAHSLRLDFAVQVASKVRVERTTRRGLGPQQARCSGNQLRTRACLVRT